MLKKIISKWYLIIPTGFLIFAALIFGICGEDTIISIHDNLDLFIPQFQMMKNTNSFFGHGVEIPFLGGIDRDNLPSEFSLYTLLFMVFPSYYAYMAGYLLKIVIAMVSVILLAKDFCGEKFVSYRPLVYMTGLAYGMLNVFPAFGISFASIPLVIYLLRRIYTKSSVGWHWYVALFLYPLLSYFSYFGLFILGYLVIAIVWLWIRDRKCPVRLLIALVVLGAGYVLCEYRLFGVMLFGDQATIRSTMDSGSYSAGQVLFSIGEVFVRGMFHAESVHTYVVLPVCLIYFVVLNVSYIKDQNVKGIFHDVYNLLMAALLFNSVVYGIYYWEGFRSLVETICPPLTGWQFNRTIFFSPFVWYAAFFLVLKRLYDAEKSSFFLTVKGKQFNAEKGMKGLANGLVILSVLVILFSGTRYNDLYHTCVAKVYEQLKNKETDQLSYREFYSTELFEQAKEDLGYSGQWSAAYGFYPAILEYNDIKTLDGYLGFYEQSYKDAFRKIIAPALERVPESREYYDSWGARAYLYSGTDLSIVGAVRDYQVTDSDIYIDLDAFKALGGRYIFSRIEIANAEETGLTLAGTYTHESSPYTLYVYQTTSRYQSKEHSGLTFEEMKDLTYDIDKLESDLQELTALAEEATESGEASSEERVLELYDSVMEELLKLSTCNSIAQVVYYQNVLDEENGLRQQEVLEDAVDFGDAVNSALRQVCLSPYRTAMETVLEPALVDALSEYEEMTDEEKELYLKENSLEQEYELAAQEEYTYSYEGQEWDMDMLMEESYYMSQEQYIEIYQGINSAKNSVLGEIYLELVQLRQQWAEMEGYDNYAEYAYSERYIRDYTVEDAMELFEEIKEEVVPLLADADELYNSQDIMLLYFLPQTNAAERFSLMSQYLEEIDGEMKETFDYMEEHQLYDMDPAAGKAGTGFTIGLDYFGDVFIFDSPYEHFYDYATAIHEFGHYHYMFRNTEDIMVQSNNIDLCEIHSQGLEMLYYDYYDDMFADDLGDVFRFIEVYQMLQNTVDAAMISEFEIRVYQEPDMSLEDMNKLYLELSESYGEQYHELVTELYTWTEIPHIFNSPCYYIGYSTSAFSALDILALSQENREDAVEKYMELTTLPTYAPYCEAVEYVGLRDIFEKGVPGEIVEEAVELLEN